MNTQKPTLVQVIAWMTLASGIVNLFWGFVASGTALATIIGVICIPITILPAILGVFELIYAAKLFSNPPQAVQPSTNIAVFEIACALAGNIFSMAVGILALVFYNDAVVKDYFARLNGVLPPKPATPPAPASLPDPKPAPAFEEPIPSPRGEPAEAEVQEQPAAEPPQPQPEETPAKPKKRTQRKTAKK